MRAGRGGAAVAALALAALGVALGAVSCERENPDYCDDQAPCAAGRCDVHHRCVLDGGAPPQGDGPALEAGGGCMASSECAPATPICDGTTHGCVACSDDASCKARDATTPRCVSGRCVACTGDGDCGGATPICDGNACRACRAHGECTASLVCAADGSCAATGDVLYVDAGGCAGTPDGSKAKPYCQIQDAVGALGGHHYVHVAGGSMPYGAVTVTDRSVTLVGPGGAATPTAKIFAASAVGITVQGVGQVVVVDGFEVTGGALKPGIECVSTGKMELDVLRSYVHASGDLGISASNCKLVMDQDKIGPSNANGGIAINNSDFDIQNSFFVGNGTGGPGVALGQKSGVFRHNTVASNLVLNGIGGIDCGANPKAIEYSIVWGNTQAGGSSLSGACNLTYSDIDEAAPGTGNVDQAPTFQNTTQSDYHLAAANPCCVDRIAPSVGDPDAHDYDGTPRPQPAGGSWDIGAHEVR